MPEMGQDNGAVISNAPPGKKRILKIWYDQENGEYVFITED